MTTKRSRKKPRRREDAAQAAVRVMETIAERSERDDDSKVKKWRPRPGSDRQPAD